jgi:ribosomal protein S18 acetylase RimI-like enzyme
VLTHREHDRSTVTPLIRELATWDGVGLHVSELHVGDLGWALRLPDDDLAGTLHGWWDGTRLAAAAFVDGRASFRPRLAPDRASDGATVGAVVELVESLPEPQLWSDAAPRSRFRKTLVGRGWELDPDPWVTLHRDLTVEVETGARTVRRAADDVEGRVAAQRNGFEGSTFDEPSWQRMAAGPGYDPDLDLVVLTDDGEPAACATAWISVAGGTALLEPVATHRAHRRAGWARAVVRAACSAARRAGASGIAVSTPASNEAAVAAYQAAGFHPVQMVRALTRSA